MTEPGPGPDAASVGTEPRRPAPQRPVAPVRVVLCDDHPIVREGLRLVLEATTGIKVVGEADGHEDLFDVVSQTRPDIVLLDLTLGSRDGVPLIRDLRARHAGVRVVILTMHRDAETVRQSLLAGASGYLVKGARSSEVADAIRAVARGERYVHSSVASVVVDDSLRWLRTGTGLSEREREVLGLIAAGQTAPMVAKRLGISVHTVHRHVANIGAKLDAHGLPALVRYAMEHDLLRPTSQRVAGSG